MTNAEINRLFVEQPWFVFYAIMLAAGSLAGLITGIRHILKGVECKVTPWRVKTIDILILLWAIFCWQLFTEIYLSQTLGTTQADGPEERMRYLVAAGAISQLGMLLLFLLFRRFIAPQGNDQMNTRHPGLLLNIGQALMYFLGILPVIVGLNLLWMMILTGLQSLGWDISLEPQVTVKLIAQSNHPLMVGLFAVIAVILAPLAEEMIFRAGIYRYLKDRLPTYLSIVISSLFFALLHMNLASLATLFILGSLLCLTYEWTGNIRTAILTHALFNLNTLMLLLLNPDLIGP